MKCLIPIVSLFLASLTYAGEARPPIPQGPTELESVPITALHRFAGLYIERTSSNFTKVTVKLFHSTDDGVTFPGDTGNPKTEQPFCKFVHEGGGDENITFGADCPKPEGTTHIKGLAVVDGGSISISRAPDLRSR
jgi:hypothetical protein